MKCSHPEPALHRDAVVLEEEDLLACCDWLVSELSLACLSPPMTPSLPFPLHTEDAESGGGAFREDDELLIYVPLVHGNLQTDGNTAVVFLLCHFFPCLLLER